MTEYEHVLFEAWIHGLITDNEFALAWQLAKRTDYPGNITWSWSG